MGTLAGMRATLVILLFLIHHHPLCIDELQGSHCTGKTGKIVKSNSRQGKHREFENFGKTQGKLREFENFRMILNSNSHLNSRAAGRDCCKGMWRPKYNYRLLFYL